MNFCDDLTPDLLTALRDGDYKAFDRIYLGCFEPIRAFFHLLPRNDADAEEMSQDLFAKVRENRAKIDPSRNFRAYLYAMAKSAARSGSGWRRTGLSPTIRHNRLPAL